VRRGRDLILRSMPYARERIGQSWWYVLTTWACLATGMAAAAIPAPWFIRVPVSLLTGLILCRAFVLYHDFQHGAILRKSAVARALMSLYGLLFLTPFSVWRHSHNHHHAHNGKFSHDAIGTFPLMTTEEYLRAGPLARLAYRVRRSPLVIMTAYVTVFLGCLTILPLLLNPRKHLDCAASLLLHVALLAAATALSPQVALYAVVGPCAVASALGVYLFYIQHNCPGLVFSDPDDWEYAFAAVRSSSFLRTGRLMAWVTANIGYHHVHHLNHRIPFYRLPEAMEALPEFRDPVITTLSLRSIRSCLALKLWDASSNRLITFDELRTRVVDNPCLPPSQVSN
jgi:acyl-lipid omega-6 desaturase (Delta-12 desaturase)